MKSALALLTAVFCLAVWSASIEPVQSKIRDRADTYRFSQDRGFDRWFLVECFLNDTLLCHDD